jgi:hypothetical protein
MPEKFIVAEVTKNWVRATPVEGDLLSQKFEKVINTNFKRGYDLIEWKITSFINGDVLTETIIAIFKLRE